MATVDKAITIEDQVDLKVRDRSKEMEIEADVQEEQPELDNFEELEDGTLVFGEATPPLDNTDFYANLAEVIDSQELNVIKNDLMDSVESDKDSRSDWEQTYRDGLEYLGMKYDCLLYTSPSPRDGLLSRMPSSA